MTAASADRCRHFFRLFGESFSSGGLILKPLSVWIPVPRLKTPSVWLEEEANAASKHRLTRLNVQLNDQQSGFYPLTKSCNII